MRVISLFILYIYLTFLGLAIIDDYMKDKKYFKIYLIIFILTSIPTIYIANV